MTSKQKTPDTPTSADENPADGYAFVINPEARIRMLSYYAKRPDRPESWRTVTRRDESGAFVEEHVKAETLDDLEAKTVVCTPGVCAIPNAIAEACHLAESVGPAGMRLEAPWMTAPYVAIPLAAGTASRHALRLWRSKETRPEVITAIDERLARKPASATAAPRAETMGDRDR